MVVRGALRELGYEQVVDGCADHDRANHSTGDAAVHLVAPGQVGQDPIASHRRDPSYDQESDQELFHGLTSAMAKAR